MIFNINYFSKSAVVTRTRLSVTVQVIYLSCITFGTGASQHFIFAVQKRATILGTVKQAVASLLSAKQELRAHRGTVLSILEPKPRKWCHAAAVLRQGIDPVPIVQEAWLALGAGLDGSGKISPPPPFEPRTVQPVASRYTGWAFPPAKLDAIYIYFWGNSKALILTWLHSLCTMNNRIPVIHCVRNTI